MLVSASLSLARLARSLTGRPGAFTSQTEDGTFGCQEEISPFCICAEDKTETGVLLTENNIDFNIARCSVVDEVCLAVGFA